MSRGFWTYAGLHLLALAALLVLLFCWPAAAQNLCMPTPEFERQIAGHGEAEIGVGIAAGSAAAVMRVFASPGGATFTVIMTTATGASCLIAVGRDLDIVPPPPAGEKES